MRARNLAAPIVVLAALVSACSNPPAEVARETDADFAAELDLALFSGMGSGESAQATVSELELARPDEAGTSPSVAPARRESAPAAPMARTVRLIGQPLPVAEVEEAPAAPPIVITFAGAQVSAEGGADDSDRGVTEARTPGRSAGPIIIRGGVVDTDNCKLHIPGHGGADPRGTIGVLINDKVPYGIGRGTPTYADRGRPTAPRFGGGFAGGIR